MRFYSCSSDSNCSTASLWIWYDDTWPLTSFEMHFFFSVQKIDLSFMLIQSSVKAGWAKNRREIKVKWDIFSDFQTWCLLRRSRCWKDYSLMPFVRSGFGFCIAHQSSESLLSLFWKGFLMMLPKVAERCQRVALSISKIFPLAFSVFRGHTDSISFKIFFPLASLLNSSLVSSQTFQQAFNEKFKMLQATQSLYWQNVSFLLCWSTIQLCPFQ